MLVEGAREVALEQLVVINGFGNDSPNEFEVTQVIGITVRRRIDHVGDTIAGRRREQGIHWVENFARNDNIPTS